ncbi:hypothetical protein [Mycobacterium sp.]|uniref:hypothetical protein n=1 Tax=Mycobacterium sp. TaxID=1785 RepID=UPI003F9D85F2
MRLLHFADVHLDAPFRWATGKQPRRRRRPLRETLLRGGLYEQGRFAPDMAEFLRVTFAEIAPLPIFLAVGNHDWLGPLVKPEPVL